jgi:peptidoglycan L-alanyl-D-glutamate endopeptidase CwlK
MTRDIDALHWQFAKIVKNWLKLCEARMYEVVVYSTLRTNEEQAALYAQGRESVMRVNELRQAAGLGTIVRSQNNRVTNAKPGTSWHNYGLAIDFFPLRLDGKPDWAYSPKDPADIYDEAVQLAKGVDKSIVWGGAWEDYGHLEWHPGMTIQRAKEYVREGRSFSFWTGEEEA